MQLKEISIEIIRKCPNNCVHCSSCSSMDRKEIIPYEIFCKIIDEAAMLGLKTLCFSGGEPFLHPEICKMIDYVSKLGVEVYVYTSGIYVVNNTVSGIPLDIIRAVKYQVKKMIFNVEASTEETYNKIMGTQGYFPFMIESIREAVNSGILCEAHFVPMKHNISEIESTIELCDKLGVSKISFLRLVSHGRAKINKDTILLDSSETKELKLKLYQISTQKKDINVRIGTPLAGKECKHNCEAANGKLNIKYDGLVYPCEVFKNQCVRFMDTLEASSIYERSLIDIYYSSPYLIKAREYINNFFYITDEENCIGQKYIQEGRKKNDL